MDARRATEMAGQVIDLLAGMDHEDSAVRMAALDQLAQRATDAKASIQAEVDAQVAALNGG